MESPLVSRRRATRYGLHVSVAAGGLVALLAFAVFNYAPAACVAGTAWIAGGLLALLSRRSPASGLFRGAARSGALLSVYGAALLVAGALLLRSGAGALRRHPPGRYDRSESGAGMAGGGGTWVSPIVSGTTEAWW